jgi:hypothetical protein
MAWSENDFMANTEGLESRYKDDNKWFYQSKKTSWKEESQNAWLLYTKANTNSLGTLLLGDAKIRTAGDLLKNFGMASGGGISDIDEIQKAKEIQDWRAGVTKKGEAERVIGPGSILNDKNWTPFLNDAFVLGGVHGGQDFHWAEVEFQSATQLDAAKAMRDRAYLWNTWRTYLVKGRNFWSEGFVRIFARELIGLKTFNYMPMFTTVEIFFKPASTGGGSFKEYLDALTKVKFEEGASASQAINRELGEFLFGDEDALSALSLNKAAAKI